MMRRLWSAAIALLVLASGGGLFAADDKWVKGRVEKVGTVYNPGLNLVSDDGKRFDVVGELTGELSRLDGGAKLEVQIVREAGGSLLPRVRAVGYRIVELTGGDRPEVGIVKVSGGAVSLVTDGKELKLQETSVAKKLLARHGEKVWVVGKTVSGGLFKVWRVGFLGAPAPSSAPATQPVSPSE